MSDCEHCDQGTEHPRVGEFGGLTIITCGNAPSGMGPTNLPVWCEVNPDA